ncbi:hypothetical protein V6N12_069673 [Hibiscus sabdariffa]|uniref:Uncharacterized protein n=1 Tax=Hibiscus sabdariffa TaxID=183260 RepID=A0ABR2FEK1_9ROSI
MYLAISRWSGLWDPRAQLLRATYGAERCSWGRPRHLQGTCSSFLQTCNVARLGSGFAGLEDEENIVPVTEDDDVHLLDADDVVAVMTNASEGNGQDVEDDVWSTTVARLGLGNDKLFGGFVGPETE